MSAEIYLKDDKHISATDAASSAGLSRDYIARLCRQGKVVGHQVGKNWYVSERSFSEFQKNQNSLKAQRREQLIQQRQQEYASAHAEQKLPSKPITHEHYVRDSAYRVQTFARHATDMQARMAAAVAIQGERMFKHASDASSAPLGVSDAVLRAAHVPTYVISPFVEFMHKLVAFAIAFALTFGTYVIVDPSAAQFALDSFKDSRRNISIVYESIMRGDTSSFVARAEQQIAAAAENPGDVVAAAVSSLARTIPAVGKRMATSVHRGVDNALYTIAFPGDIVRSIGFTMFDSDSSVAIEVKPYARGTQNRAAAAASISSAEPGTTTGSPVSKSQVAPIQDMANASYIVAAAGGLTEDILDARLKDLETRLTKQITAITAANSSMPTTRGTNPFTLNADVRIGGTLDVSTIEEVYMINGIEYTAYGHSTIGIHEEVLQTIQLQKQANGEYTYTIDFDSLEKGGDLWLFYQITDFGPSWQNLVVSLTPAFDGTVFYKKNPREHELVIYGEEAGEVSMRLTSDRYDSNKWPNVRADQGGNGDGTHVITPKK